MARRSRAKWQKGVKVGTLIELAAYISTMHSRGKTDSQILFYMGFSRGRPLSWAVLANMTLRTIEGSIRHGSMRYVEPREAEHGEEATTEVDS